MIEMIERILYLQLLRHYNNIYIYNNGNYLITAKKYEKPYPIIIFYIITII